MQTTTNYGLKTYQSGDYFNPLTVENYNTEALDTTLKSIEDKAIGRATELVSQGVHAITLLDEDCKVFKFVATANYTAGETFTVNGIQVNAYTPSGSALVSNAYVTGSSVIGILNTDGSAITFLVSGSSTADDSLKLGGELPSYYATDSDMTNAQTDITNLQNLAGNTSIVGIGDGTLTGAVSSLKSDLNDITGKGSISVSPQNSENYRTMINRLFTLIDWDKIDIHSRAKFGSAYYVVASLVANTSVSFTTQNINGNNQWYSELIEVNSSTSALKSTSGGTVTVSDRYNETAGSGITIYY